MANLDRYLAAMRKHGAEALILRADAPVAMVLSGSERPVSSQATTERQILTLLTEVLGATFVPGLSGVRHYSYASPAGTMHLCVTDSAGLEVRIEPADASVASPPAVTPQAVTPPAPELRAPAPASPSVPTSAPGRAPEPPTPAPATHGSPSAPAPAPRRGPEPLTPAPGVPAPHARPMATTPPVPVALPTTSVDEPLSSFEFEDPPIPPQRAFAAFAPPPHPEPIGPASIPLAPGYQPAAPPLTTSAPVSAKAMEALFAQMLDMKASDLHLKSGAVPMVRVDGSMLPLPNQRPLSAEQLASLVDSIMPDRNRAEFAETNDTDFAYELPGRARMRCNVFRDLAGVGAVFRQIPSKILTAEQLNLPKAVLDLCTHTKGLVVVTGPTGSGKSTTLAAMIDWINKNRSDHIITIEDPVEFVHKDQKCLVNQREVGVHTKGFKSALRAALREDPDIVLVGEMRDLETVAIAIETAETGHLVFGTLHTNTAPSTVDRLIDQFPADRQQQIRLMLSESLRGVVAQTLLKKKGGGRVAALEILLITPATANLIREGKTFQIPSVMQTGRGLGMQTLNDAMMELVKSGVVDPAEAYAKSPQKKEFGPLLTRAGYRGPWSTAKDDM